MPKNQHNHVSEMTFQCKQPDDLGSVSKLIGGTCNAVKQDLHYVSLTKLITRSRNFAAAQDLLISFYRSKFTLILTTA